MGGREASARSLPPLTVKRKKRGRAPHPPPPLHVAPPQPRLSAGGRKLLTTAPPPRAPSGRRWRATRASLARLDDDSRPRRPLPLAPPTRLPPPPPPRWPAAGARRGRACGDWMGWRGAGASRGPPPSGGVCTARPAGRGGRGGLRAGRVSPPPPSASTSAAGSGSDRVALLRDRGVATLCPR